MACASTQARAHELKGYRKKHPRAFSFEDAILIPKVREAHNAEEAKVRRAHMTRRRYRFHRGIVNDSSGDDENGSSSSSDGDTAATGGSSGSSSGPRRAREAPPLDAAI